MAKFVNNFLVTHTRRIASITVGGFATTKSGTLRKDKAIRRLNQRLRHTTDPKRKPPKWNPWPIVFELSIKNSMATEIQLWIMSLLHSGCFPMERSSLYRRTTNHGITPQHAPEAPINEMSFALLDPSTTPFESTLNVGVMFRLRLTCLAQNL